MTKTLPKEYILEAPACYDETYISVHIGSLIKSYGIGGLKICPSPMIGVVNNGEHLEVLNDIFIYIADTCSYDYKTATGVSKFKEELRALMFEAGFFG